MTDRHPAFNNVPARGLLVESMKPFFGQDELFKRKEEIISQFPIRFGDYYEPFIVHGSIFFNLYNHKRIFNKAFLSTNEKDIVSAYRAVRDEPERVDKVLSVCLGRNTEDYYEAMTHVRSPAALIYLYRAGYPVGWRKRDFEVLRKPISKEIESLYRCSDYMKEWLAPDGLRVSKWQDSLMSVNKNDLVFCAPGDFGLGPDAFLTDKLKYMYNFLKALKDNRNCHVFVWQNQELTRL